MKHKRPKTKSRTALANQHARNTLAMWNGACIFVLNVFTLSPWRHFVRGHSVADEATTFHAFFDDGRR
jgi:hypothetical protein